MNRIAVIYNKYAIVDILLYMSLTYNMLLKIRCVANLYMNLFIIFAKLQRVKYTNNLNELNDMS